MNFSTLNQEDKISLLRGSGFLWCFFAGTIFSATYAYLNPDIERWLISIFLLICFLISLPTLPEVKVLVKHLSRYRFYTVVTFANVLIVAVVWLWEAPLTLSVLLSFAVFTNGLIWPFITLEHYKKNYTRLFGAIDA